MVRTATRTIGRSSLFAHEYLSDYKNDDRVCTTHLRYVYQGASPTTTTLKLDSHDLDIESVGVYAPHAPLGAPPVGLDTPADAPKGKKRDFVAHVAALRAGKLAPLSVAEWTLDNDARTLTITLPRPLARGDEIAVRRRRRRRRPVWRAVFAPLSKLGKRPRLRVVVRAGAETTCVPPRGLAHAGAHRERVPPDEEHPRGHLL